MECESDQVCSNVALSASARGLMANMPTRAIAASHNTSVSQCRGNNLAAWRQANRPYPSLSRRSTGYFIASRKPLAMKKNDTPAQVISSSPATPT